MAQPAPDDHKSPECLEPFLNASIGAGHGAKPFNHGQLVGWAMDGFGVYSYQDVGGAAPIVDECGGHFGPTDNTGKIEYHYHSRTYVPYHLACQGPSLGNCASTQRGTNYCHPGCGYEVCVQPGTDEGALRDYLGQWDPTWLDQYTVNPFHGPPAMEEEEEEEDNLVERLVKDILEMFV